MKINLRNLNQILAICLLACSCIGCINSEDMHRNIQNEYSKITPLSNATIVDQSSNHEIGRAIHSISYRTDSSWDMILQHYSEELTDNQWVKIDEGKLTDWGTDLGGRCIVYKKDDLNAVLTFAGSQANYGWDYGFGINWRGMGECPPEPN